MLETELLAYITRHIATTDIFCLQETDATIREKLIPLLADDFDLYHAAKQNDDALYLVATYVRKGVTVRAVETPLNEIPGAGIALSVTVQTQDREVTVSNVHGAPYPGHKLDTPERLAQSHGLLQFSETRPGTHVFIGDFNLLPDTESVRLFSKQGFDDLIQRFTIPTTRNYVAWDRFPDSKQLYADYAFVRSDTSIASDFSVDEDVVSDHLPLRLSLQLGAADIEKTAISTSVKIVQNT